MFCNKCGANNKDYSGYCLEDGESLKENNVKIDMKKLESKFCNNCGNGIDKGDLYCTDCGISQFEALRKKASTDTNKDLSKKLSTNRIQTQKLEIDKVLKSALISFFAIFMVNFILSFPLNTSIINLLKDEFGISENIKFINGIGLTLMGNLVNTTLNASFLDVKRGLLTIDGALPLLALIPVVIFTIKGIMLSNKDIKSGKAINMINILSTGVVYGLLLAILAAIGESTFEISYLNVFESYSYVEISKKFYIISTIFNGIIISSVATLFGYVVNAKIKKREDIYLEYDFILEAVFNFIIFLFVTSIIFTAISFKQMSRDYNSSIIAILIAVYQSCVLFLGLNFGSLSAEYLYHDKISIFKMSDMSNVVGKTTANIALILLIIPIAIFFLTGKKIKERYGQNISKIVFTSLTYSILVGIFAYMNKISISLGIDIDILEGIDIPIGDVGFNVIAIIFSSFIFSLIITLAGSLLTNVDEAKVMKYKNMNTNTFNIKDKINSKYSIMIIAGLTIILVAFAATSGISSLLKKNKTPEKAVMAFFESIKDGDSEKLINSISIETKKNFEGDMNNTDDMNEFFREANRNFRNKHGSDWFDNIRVRTVYEEQDYAEVEVTFIGDKDYLEEFEVIKENNKWKINEL